VVCRRPLFWGEGCIHIKHGSFTTGRNICTQDWSRMINKENKYSKLSARRVVNKPLLGRASDWMHSFCFESSCQIGPTANKRVRETSLPTGARSDDVPARCDASPRRSRSPLCTPPATHSQRRISIPHDHVSKTLKSDPLQILGSDTVAFVFAYL
jgi:hypothetical protein